MQHALTLLAVVALAASASAAPDKATPDKAEPASPRRPPGDACRPTGAVVFEIDHRADPGAKLATSAIKVFGTGAWTRDETDADGKAATQRTGCFAKADAKQLETTLAGATWKVTTARIHCMARSATFTVFQVGGKPVYTQRLCSGDALDAQSQKKLDAAVAQVETELARAP